MNGWVRLFAALVLGLSVDIKFVLGSSVLEVQSVKHGRGSLATSSCTDIQADCAATYGGLAQRQRSDRVKVDYRPREV